LWMKALGVHAVEVSGPSSTEGYKPFAKPQRFEGVLEPLWRDGDNVLYRVGDHAGLARIVPRGALVFRPPAHGLDLDPLRPYVAALDDWRMPRADFRWETAHSARIVAGVEPNQVVSIQAAWHNGWRATVNGHPEPVQRDALGMMYIDPHAFGPVVIEMIYDGGWETRLAHWIFALTALALIVASAGAIRKRARRPGRLGRSRSAPQPGFEIPLPLG
jgi:hypothetical protein